MSKKIAFKDESQMPPLPISLGDMLWNKTGSWRYMKPTYEDKTPPCNAACPAGVDIVGIMNLASQGEFEGAWKLLKEENPFPGVCGRACFHPCESRCNRWEFDEAVAINSLERFLADYGARFTKKSVRGRGKQREEVAVVGSGPAGLSCAYFLSKMGYRVTVFEALPLPGGILRVGIPPYRLPKDVLEREIAAIEAHGVKIETNCRVGEDIGFEELKKYAAIFIATGVHRGKRLDIPGEDAHGVISALEFLREVNAGARVELSSKVVVVGGGNAAIDVARSAVRFGAEEVKIVCLESREEMPASAEEIEEAEEEGVTIQNSWGPRRILEKGGRARGIELMRCTSVFDKEGKFNPSFNEGERAQLEAGGIIVAIGEEPDPSLFNGFIEHLAAEEGMIITDHTGATSLPGVFAGGDIASPTHNIAQAIGDGKRGAVAIDSYLQKQDPTDVINRICVAGNGAISMVKYFHPEARARTPYVVAFSDLNTLYFDYSDRVPKIKLLPFERREGFEEVAFGVTEEMAMKEAGRCFSCGVCNECDNCYIFCPDISILKNANGLEHKIDYEYCKGCGICFVECPRYAFSLEVEQR